MTKRKSSGKIICCAELANISRLHCFLICIRNLVNLDIPDDPAWNCIAGQYKHCSKVLFQCKDEYLSREQENNDFLSPGQNQNNKKLNNFNTTVSNENSVPFIFVFQIFNSCFNDSCFYYRVIMCLEE